MTDPNATATSAKPESWLLLKRVSADFLRPHWRAVALVVLCTLLIAVASSFYPVVIKWTFDGLQARDGEILFWAPLAVMAAAVSKGLAALAQITATNNTMTRIEVAMQDRLFRHLIDADMLDLVRDNSGDLVQRFNGDVLKVREAVTRMVAVIFRDMATAVGMIGWMFYADWRLSLILLVIIPLAVWPTIWLGNSIRKVSASMAEASGRNTSAIIEALETPRLAKLYRLENYLKERAAQRFETIRGYNVRAANYRSLVQPTLEAIGGIAVAGVLMVVGWRIVGGATSVGEFIAFITALILASQPLSNIGNFHVVVQEALASVERYYQLLDRQPAIIDCPGSTAIAISSGSITFDSVTFGYREEQPAVSGLSASFEGGKVTALVGRSGSGKTTLFGLVTRLFDPAEGRILIDGQDLRGLTLASLRDAIAVVSQDAVLYDDTIARNIGFGRPGASMEDIRAAAAAAAALGFIESFPDGFDTMVGARGEALSGGQRQRIAIARAFLKDAPILCLDEATSALDSESEAAVQAAMEKLMKGRTVLIIAHRLSTIRDADKIIVLDQGRLAEEGTHEALMAKGGLYASLHQLQFREEPA